MCYTGYGVMDYNTV